MRSAAVLLVASFAFAAGLPRPTVAEWTEVNRQVPRFVSVLPNGPTNHPTVRLFLAGGVPHELLFDQLKACQFSPDSIPAVFTIGDHAFSPDREPGVFAR